MEAYITYDVSDANTAVKNALKKKGYHDHWTSNDKTYWLPNTSVWKSDTERSAALKDIQNVIIDLNTNRSVGNKIRLERCIVVSADPWDGIPGDSYVK